MRFGVIVFPGSNCDEDVFYVLQQKIGASVKKIWHKAHDLEGVDTVIVPGGFSYGDYLRSGAIARFSPIMKEVTAHAEKGGFVLGICNGFQILTEAKLLDGALLRNNNQKYICKNQFIKPAQNTSAITKYLEKNKAYNIPIAHGEGRFYADNTTLAKLRDNEQILFQYCDGAGTVDEKNNPNGSELNIAGICNLRRNVMGMMPHPERASDEQLGNSDGKAFFESFLRFSTEHL